MLQIPERVFPPAAIHDTVWAALGNPAYKRSLRRSIADRLIAWLEEAIRKFTHFLGHLPSTRSIGIGVVVALVIFVIVRSMIVRRARDVDSSSGRLRRGGSARNDPWLEAMRLEGERRYEDAAHALYRAVTGAVATSERMRLDPSRTSGDYARELRRRNSKALLPYRSFTTRFEHVVYGRGVCDEESVRELMTLAEPFRPRARAA